MTGDVVVRRARDTDVDRVLDLLTHFDLTREFFAPWFDADPAFYPDNSWLVEEDGDLLAHLRIFPRRLRLGPAATLTVAGIGQVVTAKHARGRGHADRLLRAGLDAAHAAGFA